MKFRLLNTGHRSAAFNMALDEFLLEQIAQGNSDPCLRLYGWKPAAVSIGYFQSLEEEVDLVKCDEMDIDIVRRLTGGGAVFHDDEITYSIHIPTNLKLLSENILESYREICQGIIMGLELLKIESEFAPLNDVIVSGQKISGNAQTRKKGVILQHGTILKSVDVDKMFEILKVPDEKMKGKLISDVKKRVTSIDLHSQQKLKNEDVVEALTSGFVSAFKEVEFYSSVLSKEEEILVEGIAREKYQKKTWLNKR